MHINIAMQMLALAGLVGAWVIRRPKPHAQPHIDIEGREWVSYTWPPKGPGGEGAAGGSGDGGGGGDSGSYG